MNIFMGKLKRMSEYVAMILFFVAAFFSLLFYIGNFDGAFMPVIGNLFTTLLQVGIWLIIPLCIVMKRRSYARWATVAVSLYWLITTLFNLLDSSVMTAGSNYLPLNVSLAVEAFPSLFIAVGVFAFLVACALIVMTCFALASVVRKNAKLKLIAFLIYVGALVLFLVLFSLGIAVAAECGFGWNTYFSLICDYLLIPFAMGFIAITFGFREEEFFIPWIKEKKVAPKVETASVSVEEEVEESKTADIIVGKVQSVGSDCSDEDAEDVEEEIDEAVVEEVEETEAEESEEPEKKAEETSDGDND